MTNSNISANKKVAKKITVMQKNLLIKFKKSKKIKKKFYKLQLWVRNRLKKIKEKERALLGSSQKSSKLINILYSDKELQKGISIFNKQWNKNFLSKSYWHNKFINKIMKKGKKEQAEKLVSDILKKLKIRTLQLPLLILILILNMVKPTLTMIPKQVGIRYYKIPLVLADYQGVKFAIKWFLMEARLLYNKTERRRNKKEYRIGLKEKELINKRTKKERRLARKTYLGLTGTKPLPKKKKFVQNKTWDKLIEREKIKKTNLASRLFNQFFWTLENSRQSTVLKFRNNFQDSLYENRMYLNYKWSYTH